MSGGASDAVLLYDADCDMCVGAVAQVKARDREEALRCVALDSDEGRAVLAMAQAESDGRSMVLVHQREALRGSAAAIRILERLGKRRWAALLRLIPRVVREEVYRMVARHRRRLRIPGLGRPAARPESSRKGRTQAPTAARGSGTEDGFRG